MPHPGLEPGRHDRLLSEKALAHRARAELHRGTTRERSLVHPLELHSSEVEQGAERRPYFVAGAILLRL